MDSPWLSFALLGLFLFGSVGAEIGIDFGTVRAEIGTDQCACFPSTYTFVLDLGQLCSQTSLPSSGIESTTCTVLSESGDVPTNMVPVSVSQITVFELGQNLGTIIPTQIPGSSFITGTSFTYTSSFVGTQEALDTSIASGVFPRGLELQLRGQNLFSEIIINRFTIVFSNACDVFPVVNEEDFIGWVKFGAVSDPIDAVCPMRAPTRAPTPAPTSAPTRVPTNEPGQATTIEPTLAPTSYGQPSNGQLPSISLLAVVSIAMAML